MYSKPNTKLDELNLYIRELGERGDPKDIETLIEIMWCADKEGSNNAAWALTQIHHPLSVWAIVQDFGNKTRLDREFIAEHIKKMGDVALNPLVDALKDDRPSVRREAAYFLGEIKSPEAIKPLTDVVNKDVWGYVRHAARDALRKCKKSAVGRGE